MFTDLEPSATYYRSEYLSYKNAFYRCNNQADKNYYGRGIKFLYTGFKQFMQDVGPKPSKEHSLDRINNNGNYEPGNCRWVTIIEQARNRRHIITRAENKALERELKTKKQAKTIRNCNTILKLLQENPQISRKEIAFKLKLSEQRIHQLFCVIHVTQSRFIKPTASL